MKIWYKRPMSYIIPLLLLSALALNPFAAREAAAEEAPEIPKTRLYLSDLTLIRLGPLGLETQNRLVFQRRLMDSDSILFRDTFVNGALSLKLNPAYYKIGPTVDIQPIALLNLRLGYEFMGYFGTFGYLQSWSEPRLEQDGHSPFEEDHRVANEEAGLNYVTTGHHAFVEPTLQLKVSKVAVRTKWPIEYWNMALQDMDGDGETDRVFYDATLHTLVPANGLVVSTDTDVLYVSGKHLTAGLRYSGVFPQYGASAFAGGAEPATALDGSHHKLGPLVAWTFKQRDYSAFNRPTLLFVGGWYLDHPNTEESTFPYVLLGFSFSSDFLR